MFVDREFVAVPIHESLSPIHSVHSSVHSLRVESIAVPKSTDKSQDISILAHVRQASGTNFQLINLLLFEWAGRRAGRQPNDIFIVFIL